jgi:hypothetical protein
LGSGSLTAIYVADENACFSSADGVLFNKDRTILLCCPGGKAEHYTLPNTVTGIGNYAFEKCHLTSVTIPNSVTDIGENAFKECNLISVTIPGSVTSIGTRAFYNCTYLTSVTIPNNTSIGYQVFLNCRNLTSVTNLRIIPQYITSDVFSDVLLSKATLYVPAESVDRYQDASVWGSFGTITAYAPSAIHAPAVANAIRVYPNPVSESFRIEGITAPTPATVTDISDKTLLQQTVSGDESISVGHLPQGIYLIRVNGITAKIIKN